MSVAGLISGHSRIFYWHEILEEREEQFFSLSCIQLWHSKPNLSRMRVESVISRFEKDKRGIITLSQYRTSSSVSLKVPLNRYLATDAHLRALIRGENGPFQFDLPHSSVVERWPHNGDRHIYLLFPVTVLAVK